ncbi:efflux transporter outer membrane subunit [Burkholderia sp. Ac-20365]|uniref:efflux transporter outer membrane subunit n=1 Tax=Burkholderia sp. Ac-20365 TaxID=2703897 RepID=UPI00197BCF4C|nr:efflux transporter outer membrane subunit [Burkholderia sp. Ac-20365]MBN3761755.1 efflux transporter outer membrane subunit [Burkholderia sp. Ac-20365]
MFKRGIAACVAASVLSACSFAPPYHAPEAVIPTAFKEAGPWQTAKPSDRISRDGWWKIYDDPVLNGLEAKVVSANPDVAAAVARHDEAQAFVQQARSGLFPTIGSEASVTRQRQSDNRPLRGTNQPSVYNSADVDVGIGYDLDLWGKVRNEVKAGRADEQASADDLQSLRLSLQASLADHYFQLRGLDQRTKLLQETIVTYQHALKLTESRHSGGLASGMDVSRAQTQLASAQASVDDTAASRALLEHAIATLTGTPASSFALAPATPGHAVPQIPVGVPSELLQRRPDIAAAERRVAAANETIGVAKAAYFPDVSLGLDGGYQSDTFSPWLAAPNEIWSIGPQLMFTLFDGGRRDAQVANARAKLAENGAKFRETVLSAFQQVEDELALLHHLGDESRNEDNALASAEQTLTLATSQYRDGAVSYLDVVTAQTTELDAQIASLDLRTRQLVASVNLIQALGGSWQ